MNNKRLLLPIGGWCGPALILGKLGLRDKAFPFDFSRVTLDGVAHFTKHGFERGFFPPGARPYRPECVGIWVLFRGQHTAFAHFDLNDDKIHDAFYRKIERYENAIDGKEGPITFFRTVTARNPQDELNTIPEFHRVVRERNKNLDFRTVVAVHDQGLSTTTELRPMDEQTRLWALEYEEDSSKTLFDRSQAGYAKIVAKSIDEYSWTPSYVANWTPSLECSEGGILTWGAHRFGGEGVVASDTKQKTTSSEDIDEDQEHSNIKGGQSNGGGTMTPVDPNFKWKAGDAVDGDLLTAKSFPWRPHNNLALIEGIASVGGTCRGIGSTLGAPCEHDENFTTCVFCGSDNFHKANKPFRTDRPFTDEEDELLLIHLYKILTGGDKVEAVEQLAHEMNRGAYEIILRIQFLTNSSTKITEGLDLGDDA